MTIELIRPNDLSSASGVNTDAAIPVDNGTAVEKATPKQIVDAGRAIASEAQAIAGVNNTTAMTPLTTRQAIDADTSGSIAKARAWAESTLAPGDPGTKSSKTWAEEAAASAAATEAIALQFELDDQFTGDGTTTPRELGFTPNADTRLVVFIDGLAQPTTAFSYVGTTLVPSEAWPIGLPIRIMGRVGFAVDPQPASTVSYGGDTVQTKLDDLDKGAAPDRATAVSRISGGWVPTNGMLYLFGAEIYQGFTGATAIADMPGLIPVNPTPEHHGCAGDWDSATQIGTDDQTRFVEFLAYLGSSRVPGRLPARKNYRLTAPIVINQFDIDLQGAGGNASIITLDHTSKIGFQNRRSGSTFANFKFEASDVRRAGAGKTSIAFLLSDTAGGSSGAFAKVHHVNVSGHPGHGIVNGAAAADISQCIAWDNGGHGIVHDASGVYSGIVTAGFSGWSNYELCRAYNCGGHGICIGHPDDSSANVVYRLQMDNCETYGNATDAAVRHDTSQIYVMAMGGTISECAAECGAGAGMTISGKYLRVINPRFTSPSGSVIKIADGTSIAAHDILIDTMYVNGGVVAVAVDISGVTSPETKRLRIIQHNTTNITAAAADTNKFAVYQFGVTHKTLSKLYAPNLYAGGFEVGPISDFTAFTPTLTTFAAGDFSVVLGSSNECLYRRLGKYAYVILRLVFTPTFTSGGILLLGGLPFTLENTRNAKDNLPVSQFERVNTGTINQICIARNTGSSMRFNGSKTGAPVTPLDTTHFTSGTQSVICAEGWLEVA